ncbi:hypothetical protein GCM10007424_18900 [Flavobacterium suaedae]|uniref:T9SS sorting signal type C domain-containing protein n=2 Tax=Flavobacterium suaedae TaxID=1767027 RepID=A0ABQ1JYX1_9FLAO|nr:hypothetical protein GCM10007424_18900 [Flavobacterium suaedae]
MLLPFIGYSQTNLVSWNTTSAPTPNVSEITADAISVSSGNSLSNDSWSGYRIQGSPNGSKALNYNLYTQFSVSVAAGNTLTPSTFSFTYNSPNDNNGPKKLQVRYSTSPSFPSNGTELGTVNSLSRGSNSYELSFDFPAGYTVSENTTLYIRLYTYNQNNKWYSDFRLRNTTYNASVNGPTLSGTVTSSTNNGGDGGTTNPVTGALNGTYNVGNGGDFATITEAVNYLNDNGVSGPVTFLLTQVLYNNNSGETFPIVIEDFSGSSAANTVTFKPNTGINAKIESSNVNDWTGVSAVFKFQGADYITFNGSNTEDNTRNLIITNKDIVNYVSRSVFWLASNGSNGSTNITIKNCKIKQDNKNQGSNFCTGIYTGRDQNDNNGGITIAQANADNSNLTVQNNNFINVKQGVYVNGGNGGNRTTNVVITKNDLGAETNTETIIQPAYLFNVDGFEYSENYIHNLYRDTNAGDLRSAGIHVAGNTTNGYIIRNKMRDLTRTTTDSYTFAGITLESTNSNANILVANNFILNVAAQGNTTANENGHGINVADGGGYKIYNNTIVLNTNQQNNGYTAALYVHSDVDGGLDVRNNMFINNQTTGLRRTAILVNKPLSQINTVFTHLDYNNLYSTDKIGFISNSGSIDWSDNPDYQTTLSGWQSVTGKDTNSINELPVFVGEKDLHLASDENEAINNLGTLLSGITIDIDGQVRNIANPDMGADEFGSIELPEPGSGEGIYCDSSVTWNGTEWLNGEPTADTDVIFAGDYTQNSGDLYACSIFVLDGVSVTFEANSDAFVTHAVTVEENGNLTFESSSNLIQTTEVQNIGIVTVKRNSSKLKRLDYTAWSSPVSGSQTLLEFSPLTLTNRFYIYNTNTNLYNTVAPETTTFEKAKGYLIRVPNNFSSETPTVYEGSFEGTPNNGTVRIPLTYTGGNDSHNLVGNPYPSPININRFIDENIQNIQGTLWLWRKTNDPSKSSYCTVNKMGYVANSAPGGNSQENNGNDLIEDPFDITGEGVLNTGQGFIVRAINDEELVFKNSMRDAVNFSNFFRTEDTQAQQNVQNQTNRYWLNVVNADETATPVFSQALIAHSALSTNGYDNGYDGKSLLDADVNLYTVIVDEANEEDMKLAIQTRSIFDVNDTVKLGFSTEIAGTFEITIDHMDGLFAEGQEIYLVDNLTDTTYNLQEGDYSFTSETGTFENRFEIIYTIEALGTDVPQITKNEVVVYQQGKTVNIQSPQTIESVTVYDMVGKTLYTNNKVDNTEFSATLNTQQQVGIVVITLDNQQVVTKKIMMN